VTGYLKGKESLWDEASLLNMGFYADNMIRYGGIKGAAKPCRSPSPSSFLISRNQVLKMYADHRGRSVYYASA
jgi:hypothetical protein